jgi:hypothetical protein
MSGIIFDLALKIEIAEKKNVEIRNKSVYFEKPFLGSSENLKIFSDLLILISLFFREFFLAKLTKKSCDDFNSVLTFNRKSYKTL